MKTVKFLQDYRKYKKGDKDTFGDATANVLVKLEVAIYDEKMKKEIQNAPIQKVITSAPTTPPETNPTDDPEKDEKDKSGSETTAPRKGPGRPPKQQQPEIDNTYRTTSLKAE